MKVHRESAGDYFVEHNDKLYHVVRSGGLWDVLLTAETDGGEKYIFKKERKLGDYRTKGLAIEALAQGLLA